MTALDATIAASETPAVVAHPAGATRRRRRKPSVFFWLAVAWLAVVVFLAVFAGVLPFVKDWAIRQPGTVKFNHPFTSAAWLGTDSNKRDVFSYCVYGARASLVIGIATSAIGTIVGGSLGLLAGYYRGKLDALITGAADVLLAFPALILLIAITSFWGRDLYKIVIALAILTIAPLARLVRANTLVYAQREFVTASRALGAPNRRIIWREILPNVVPAALSYALLTVGIIIVAESALSFLGQGLNTTTASWGTLIVQGKNDLQDAPWVALAPATIMFLTVLALNHVGERFRGRFDVREAAV
jgi:peptide/nickel transport system permease protein